MAIIGNASFGDQGLHNNEPGNQRKLKKIETGVDDLTLIDEVKINQWIDLEARDGRKLKYVFRFKDEKHRRLMAQAMINACSNPYVGYDDWDRNSYRVQVGLLGYSVDALSKVKKPCNCDCSSLLSLCFFCATGKDIGSNLTTEEGSLDSAIRRTGLCTEITYFNNLQKQTGQGLLVGDIVIWIGESGGHTAVVVSEDNDASVVYNQDNIPWISGITGVVIAGIDRLHGQDKKKSLQKSSNSFRIFALNSENKLKEISKVVAIDDSLRTRYIYGYSKVNFAFNLIGDSRTVQLGSVTLGRNTTQNSYLYGLVPDNNIFAWWGCRLVDLTTHTISRQTYTVKGIVYSSTYSDRDDAFTIWIQDGTTQKAFQLIGAVPASTLDLSSYHEDNALVGKMLTFSGYIEVQNGLYSMLSYEKMFSPDPDNYSCPEITKVEEAGSSTSTGYTISQIKTIVNQSSNIYKKFSLSQKAKDLVLDASKSDLLSACFWFGINDIQIYKDAFLGNLGATREFYIKSFVEEYVKLMNLYLEKCSDFNSLQNRIYITSIVSTSNKEKDYYQEQGSIISQTNTFIKNWVETKQNDWAEVNSSTTKDGYWLQYVELNIKSNGDTYANSQSFVKVSDFRDDIHFTRNWFEEKYLPRFDFSSVTNNVGEIGLESPTPTPSPVVDYSALAPKDWECSSRDINWYLKNYPRKILDWFVSRGFSAAFAIGIIANMRGESYFCPWIPGDYSAEYNVSSKLWISVNGVPVPTTAPWFEPGGYSDTTWRNGFSRVYRTQNENRPSSFGFCQWHNTGWAIQNPSIPSNWQTDGLILNGVDYRAYGRQIGRGANMMNFCLNQASHRAPWSANPVGQLEYLLTELPHYPTVWAMRNIGSSMANARKVAEEFCIKFESPPEKAIRAAERSNRAEGYWNWLILHTVDYFGA